jgi:acetyltransferase-like isoleucine patch superfamily enzyme
MTSRLKPLLVTPLRVLLRSTARVRDRIKRIYCHGALAAQLRAPLPASTVVLGHTFVHGTGDVRFGDDALLYPQCHLETHDPAHISLGDGVVLSRGVHLVAMAGITIGSGSMIGEYTSIRDGNHARAEGIPLRGSGHTSNPIVIGSEVWVGRGVTILGGITIGDGATIGANAVVTHDVAAGTVVAGVPAAPLRGRTRP